MLSKLNESCSLQDWTEERARAMVVSGYIAVIKCSSSSDVFEDLRPVSQVTHAVSVYIMIIVHRAANEYAASTRLRYSGDCVTFCCRLLLLYSAWSVTITWGNTFTFIPLALSPYLSYLLNAQCDWAFTSVIILSVKLGRKTSICLIKNKKGLFSHRFGTVIRCCVTFL